MRVLELGAGPGRFTIELARLDARVDDDRRIGRSGRAERASRTRGGLRRSRWRRALCSMSANTSRLGYRLVRRCSGLRWPAFVCLRGRRTVVRAPRRCGTTRWSRARECHVAGGIGPVLSCPSCCASLGSTALRSMTTSWLPAISRVYGKSSPDSHTCRMFRWRAKSKR